MIHDNENEAKNGKYEINRPRPRLEHKYTKNKMGLSIIMDYMY